jgi:glycosyltransferase involved in cell wall biosynthesis
MKIIQTCGSRSWGGLEMETLKIADALSKRGHAVTLVCSPDLAMTHYAQGGSIELFPILRGGRHGLGDIGRMIHLINSMKPDVIHTHLSHDMWTVVPAMRRAQSKARYLLTKHMSSRVIKKDPLHRMLYNRLDVVIAISDIIHRNVLETCPVPPEKVHTLINGVETDKFDPCKVDRAMSRDDLGIKADEIVIGMIGRLTPGKGQREFLRAARIVLDRSTLPCRFLMVGDVSYGEENYEKEVRNLIESLNLGNRLIMQGFTRDVTRLYAAMDILAFPSYDESLGSVLLEAMAMALPVVGSNSGAVPELVTDGENGFLVPPRQHEGLAEKLLELMMDSKKWEWMGAAGRLRVLENYGFDRYMEKLEQFYT